MSDESIVPKKYTPVLRADATDDLEDVEGEGESGTKYALGGTVSQARMVCPVCGLESCGHNLEYVRAEE